MKKISLLLVSAIAMLGVGLWFVSPVLALDCNNPSNASEQAQCALNTAETGSPSSGNTNGSTIYTTIGTIINTLLFAVGIISVVMIIYGAITYVTSAGASDKTKKARNTIIYSVVGLAVSILAFALVNFVVNSLNGSGSGSGTTCPSGQSWNATTKKCE